MVIKSDFHDKEMPKPGFNRACFVVITIDSALKKDENYYPKLFWKKFKYIKRKKKVVRYIIDE